MGFEFLAAGLDPANVSAEKMGKSAGFVFHVLIELRRVTLSYFKFLLLLPPVSSCFLLLLAVSA